MADYAYSWLPRSHFWWGGWPTEGHISLRNRTRNAHLMGCTPQKSEMLISEVQRDRCDSKHQKKVGSCWICYQQNEPSCPIQKHAEVRYPTHGWSSAKHPKHGVLSLVSMSVNPTFTEEITALICHRIIHWPQLIGFPIVGGTVDMPWPHGPICRIFVSTENCWDQGLPLWFLSLSPMALHPPPHEHGKIVSCWTASDALNRSGVCTSQLVVRTSSKKSIRKWLVGHYSSWSAIVDHDHIVTKCH